MYNVMHGVYNYAVMMDDENEWMKGEVWKQFNVKHALHGNWNVSIPIQFH